MATTEVTSALACCMTVFVCGALVSASLRAETVPSASDRTVCEASLMHVLKRYLATKNRRDSLLSFHSCVRGVYCA